MTLPSLPGALSHDTLLRILVDNYHIQAARYMMIVDNLTGQLSQTFITLETLRQTGTNISVFSILVNILSDSSCQILNDCKMPDCLDFTNSTVPYKQ